MSEQKKEASEPAYLTKRITVRKSKLGVKEAAKEAMETVGYVVKALDGWVVKEYHNGTIERIKQIETIEPPKNLNFG